MCIGLPVLGCILLFALGRMRGSGWRDALLHAATAWGVVAALLTEGLSLIRFLSSVGLAVAWTSADLLFLGGIYYCAVRSEKSPGLILRDLHPRTLDCGDLWLLSGVGVVLAAVGLNAMLSPPNTADVMTYHLPRVVHWLQQRSLAFYPTQESRQLQMAPGGEFLILQLHALWGGDRLDNLIQWCSFVGSVVGVSIVARELGAGPRGQALAAVVCATIPEGLLQASGSGNDYVLTFWLTSFTWYFLRYSRTECVGFTYGVGSAAGLACLTKPTALIIIPPIAFMLSLAWTNSGRKLFLKMLPAMLLLVVAVNAGYWARNAQQYGSPLGPTKVREFKLTNDTFTFETTASNLVRNAALHLATPNNTLNDAVERFLIRLIHGFGADENDPRTTWMGTRFHIAPYTLHEAFAGNPVHLALILITLLVVPTSSSFRQSYLLPLYMSALVFGFVAFCVILRWQPYHTRLHLPFFVLWSAAIGTAMERRWRKFTTSSLGFVLLLLAVPAVALNQARPLLTAAHRMNVISAPRDSLYFTDRPSLFQPYDEAAALVNATGCRTIGLDAPPSSYEYPLLVLLKAENGEKDVRYVEAFSKSPSKHPICAVICLECGPEKQSLYEAEVGPAARFPGWVTVFTRPDSQVRGAISP